MTAGQVRVVGRGRELALVDRLVGGLDGGGESLFLQLVGEPGIGKTRLLAEALARAERLGAATFAGRASEFERALPFAVFSDALDERLAALAPTLAEELGEDLVRELAAVFPSLAAAVEERPTGLPSERYRLHRAVGTLIERLAAERPLVLALDDLHWADSASLELVVHLLRRPPRAPVLLVVAYRPYQLPPPTLAALESGQRDAGGALLDLKPLEESEARELLPDDLPPSVRSRIWRESGGNPLYLEELARAAERTPPQSPPAATPGDEGVPVAVAASIAEEIGRLSEGARGVLEAAAVLGDPFEPELAAEVAQSDEAHALTALDELLERDLVQPAETPRRFRFRHPIVRRAVYESVQSGRRLAAHERAAEVLDRRGYPPLARAHHVENSARAGDEAGIALLTEAGYAAAPRAPATAARWFEAALRLLPGDEDPRRTELLLARASTLGSSGRLEESRDAFHQVLARLPHEPTPMRTRTVAFAAVVEHLLGNHEEAQSLLLAPLRELPDRRSPEAAELAVELAYGCFFNADWEGMRHWAGESLAAEVEDTLLRAAGAGVLALAAYGLGDVKTAREQAGVAAALVDGLPDASLAARLEAVCWLGWAEYCVGTFDQAVRHMHRAIAIARSTGQEHLVVAMLIVEAMGLLSLGRATEAEDLAEAAIESSLLSANDLFLTWAFTLRCMVEMQVGDLRAAVRYGEQAVTAGARSRSPWAAVAGCYLAEAWLESGDPQRCRSQLLGTGGDPDLPPFAFYWSHSFEVLTGAELALGRVDAAGGWAERAGDVAERLGLDWQQATAARARAAVALARGEHDAAADEALEAASAAAAASLPEDEARARLLAGKALAGAGRQEAAAMELERARTTFERTAATRRRDEAALELRRLQRRPPGAGRDGGPAPVGLEDLSARELEVAELLTAGKTNREIAAELGLSEKTVESYLSRMFGKLGVSSRAAVAALVERSRRPGVAPGR